MEKDMPRYSVINENNKREIVLLKSTPCKWGVCTFCDYILDNDTDIDKIVKLNKKVLENVQGTYQKLEIVNSGSCFELPEETLNDIKQLVAKLGIKRLFFESHYMYIDKLEPLKEFFGVPITFKCGIETFDNQFRNKVLKKGIIFESPKEVASHFESVCLLVGMKGQTKEMIKKDIEILLNNFDYGCINIYINNSTNIKQDPDLVKWFLEEYGYLKSKKNIDLLVNNTDFGIGD
jgi:hypothetical protein